MGSAQMRLPYFSFMLTKVLTTIGQDIRLKESINEIRKLGIIPQVFYAIEDSDPKMSFNRSIKKVLSDSDDILLLFEDDVLIKDFHHIHDAIDQLPDDWDICYLGANLIAPVEKYSDNLYKTYGAWTTHAVLYHYPNLIGESYNDLNLMFDDWLSKTIHPMGNTYIVSPMIAWQKPHQSGLWSHYADYTDIFNASANKIL
jgi:hypothetical protein